MANKPEDLLSTTETMVYVIEAAVVAGANPVWTPIPVMATTHTKKLAKDGTRALNAGLISLNGILAYRHLEHAVKAFTVVSAGAIATQFRIVKMDAIIKKTFVSGSAL